MRSLESLPEDILLSILQFSDLQEIFALSSVSERHLNFSRQILSNVNNLDM